MRLLNAPEGRLTWNGLSTILALPSKALTENMNAMNALRIPLSAHLLRLGGSTKAPFFLVLHVTDGLWGRPPFAAD
jgi:hypothetical protein